MASDDRVLVIGDDDRVADPAGPHVGRRRSAAWVLILLVGLAAALVTVAVAPQDEAPSVADPGGLDAPAEPPRAFVATTVAAVDVPDMAMGWRQARLVGTGWGVTSVAHGPDGWLAVSAGAPTVAHVSQNAVLWQAHTVHGLAVSDPIAAVGDGVVAIAGGYWWAEEPASMPVGGVSRDGGDTWELFQHEGFMTAQDVEIVGGRVFVAGSTGPAPGFVTDNPSEGRVWEVVDGSLVEVVSAGAASNVAALVAAPDGEVLAFGHTVDGAAVWEVGTPGHVLPGEIGTNRTFVDVERTPAGFTALVGFQNVGSGAEQYISSDGRAWQVAGDARPRAIAGIEPHGDDLVGTLATEGGLWSRSQGSLLREYAEAETGWESAAGFLDVASDGERLVVGGYTETGAALYVRGTVLDPVELVARLPADAARWREVAALDLEVDDERATWPFDLASDGSSTFVATPEQLVRVVEDGLGMRLEPSIFGVARVGSGSAGIWASVEGEDPRLYLLGVDGVWPIEKPPLDVVSSVGRIDGELIVSGWSSNGGWQIARQGSDREWSDTTTDFVLEVAVGRSEYVGLRFNQREQFFTSDTVISSNGVTWEPLDEWNLLSAPSGDQFLSARERPSVVALIDDLPDLDPIETPVAHPVGVHRVADRLIVRSHDTVYVRTGSGDWEETPIDLEHGVTGQALVIPGTQLRLAMLENGRLTILEWR